MFNEKRTLNLYTSVDSYNNSSPDIVIENITVESVRDGLLIITDTNNLTHMINLKEFVAAVY